MRRVLIVTILSAVAAHSQVYSPRVLANGQPDATDLQQLASGIYREAGARTSRDKAEAIWRFFLTDGRFVKPGFWYHIAGWAYEEPTGEVLDPMKLLNSYGFGLCYQIAPVLEAVWKAGGFEDARVWFLTGHTVAEVFYDGAYHYYDSDMMGYNTTGRGAAGTSPVASVRELERNPSIILGKLVGPKQSDPVTASAPWYPADVRANAIGGLAELFSTTSDNYVFPFERAPAGHSMDFLLRPGERLIRNFRPERDDQFYLPYKFGDHGWREFPQEIAEYDIRTTAGPRSQKDSRTWGTGAIEYRPPLQSVSDGTYEVRSPYVIIDAEFRIDVKLAAGETLAITTSTDDGRTWRPAGELRGPHTGTWRAKPEVLTPSAHGRRTAVSGVYGYLVRVTRPRTAQLHDLLIVSHIQVNPRTLPELKAGHNELEYVGGLPQVRRMLSIEPSRAHEVAHLVKNARYVADGGQGYWIPDHAGPAEFIFRVDGRDGQPINAVDAGGRFLDLSTGLAPDKFTAEVRKVTPLPAAHAAASIAFSRSLAGPYQTIWEFDGKPKWKDGDAVDRVLRWPEVDRRVDTIAQREIYVRYRIEDLGIDSFRLAVITPAPATRTPLDITHLWHENGIARQETRRIPPGVSSFRYSIDTPSDARVTNDAVLFESRPIQ